MTIGETERQRLYAACYHTPMKGVVFTEFLEMVETKFSPEMTDQIITASKVPSKGVYTAVGTYDHQEIVQLVIALSQATGIPVPNLVRAFGQHLFGRFVELYPKFFEGVKTSFDFLGSVDHYIHVEVRKLYPDAQLPHFEVSRPSERQMIMIYRSDRGMHDLAEGLIAGCAEHFGEKVEIRKTDISGGKGACVEFTLTLSE